MAHIKRNQRNKNSITTKNKSAAGNGSANVENKTTGVKKGTRASSHKLSLLERKKAPLSVRKQPAFSRLSLTMWSVLILLVFGGVYVIWDTTNNGPLINLFNPLAGNEPDGPKTYEPLAINKTKAPGKPPEEHFAWIPGGWFWMGSADEKHPSSLPIHKVYVDGFWMGKYEVTNAEWREFVDDTGYKTVAEKPPEATQLPSFAPEDWKKKVKKQPAFSIVFSPPEKVVNMSNHLQWWRLQEGADWRHPQGPKSSIEGKEDHPVVHVCYDDALRYLEWKNKKHPYTGKKGWEYRLATEAEWEFAARDGEHLKKFTWGDKLRPDEKWMANIWQGKFPYQNSKEDGYFHTAPKGTYPPTNRFGLYDMAGNVWEWCHDFYLEKYYKNSAQKNPTGPAMGFDPLEPGLPKRVQRGGSFLCDASYCERYLTYARGKGEPQSAADHTGFRVVVGPKISK